MSTRSIARVGGVAILVALLVFAALGPAKWQVRTGLGWQFDQGFAGHSTGSRLQYLCGHIYSAAGVLVAALIADIFIRARRQFQAKRVESPKP